MFGVFFGFFSFSAGMNRSVLIFALVNMSTSGHGIRPGQMPICNSGVELQNEDKARFLLKSM